jgi:hypothetical protein
MKIHNRSDQWIRGAWIEVLAATSGGGSGIVRILVLIRQVKMDAYSYLPSKLVPFEFGVSPVGL